MPLPWSKKSIIKATEGLLDSSTTNNTSSSTFSQILRGKGKRVHTEVQVIPYPCLPSTTSSSAGLHGYDMISTGQHHSHDTITNNQNQEDVNDWEVEIVPVPPKPSSYRTISFSKRRLSPEMTTMMMSSQDKRCKAVEQEVHSVASDAVLPVPKNYTRVAAPAPNHFFNCVMIADGILTDATETVLNMIVNTITVADDVCTYASTAGKKALKTV